MVVVHVLLREELLTCRRAGLEDWELEMCWSGFDQFPVTSISDRPCVVPGAGYLVVEDLGNFMGLGLPWSFCRRRG